MKIKSNIEAEKQKQECLVFQKFIKARDPTIGQCDIETRPPPEPDILYSPTQGQKIAFELAEVCSSEIASAITNDLRTRDCTYIRAHDPSSTTLKSKLSKTYHTQHPIELLLYTNGRVVSPDDLVIAELNPIISSQTISFKRVWFWGDKVHLLFER
jgi:hypothetical protein